MGFLLITESMSFTPSDYGIDSKTPVTAVLVGSGAGGSTAYGGVEGGGSGFGAGGASGRGGIGSADSGYNAAGGGGGGGGFGAGGGGGSYTSRSKYAGNGGGAGEIVTKCIMFSNASEAITITVGRRVPADTPGEATSIGNLAKANGGKVGAGGKGRDQATYSGGGGGGAGGFQLGMGFIKSTAGTGGEEGRSYNSPYAVATPGTGAGGGGGGAGSTKDKTSGGKFGGGAGGKKSSSDDTSASKGEDGWCLMGKAGSGVVLLMW